MTAAWTRILVDMDPARWGEALAPGGAAVPRAPHPGPKHGDYPRWQRAVDSLPQRIASRVDWRGPTVVIGDAADCDDATRQRIAEALMALRPWRKGPFSVCGIDVDAEWRADIKWQRLAGSLNLRGATVLDVGCNNGYYALRMLGAGARWVIGVDPALRAVMQYRALARLLREPPRCEALALALEDLPSSLPQFDWVFSMGLLYHRREPLRHLALLRGKLRGDGRLALETLCLDRADDAVLRPPGRYAGMRNVWSLPAYGALRAWLRNSGFRDVELLDVSATASDEQRRSAWSPGHSLSDFLKPENPALTVEGHPAPHRAIVLARR